MIDQMQYQSSILFSSSTGNPYSAHHNYSAALEVSSGGNRSRLDSGTSVSSESSKGTGKPPRRRSHRPRGCRGGSNRRRNKAGDVSVETTASTSKGNDRPGSKIILVKHSKNKYGTPFNKGSIEKDSSALHDSIYANNNRVRSSSSSSVSTAPTTDFSASQDAEDLSFLNDFSMIQSSFSDSSSDAGVDVAAARRGNPSQILPPLLPKNFPTGHIHYGPNPYALQNTNDISSVEIPEYQPSRTTPRLARIYLTTTEPVNQPICNQHHYAVKPTYTASFENNFTGATAMGPPPPCPARRMPGLSNMAISTGISSTIPGACSRGEGYHSARLEIQRNTVEGGSLFLTSPRSFLMGKRNDMPCAGSAP